MSVIKLKDLSKAYGDNVVLDWNHRGQWNWKVYFNENYNG